MSAVEIALEKVRVLSESQAKALLTWLDGVGRSSESNLDSPQSGAAKAVGFARRYRKSPRSTEEWMLEIRLSEG